MIPKLSLGQVELGDFDRNLEQLQKYLEVSDDQVLGAAASLAMLSPVGDVGKLAKSEFGD